MTNSERTVNTTTPVRRVKGDRRSHHAENPPCSSSEEAPVLGDPSPVPASGFSVVVLTTWFSPLRRAGTPSAPRRRSPALRARHPTTGTTCRTLPRSDAERGRQMVPGAGRAHLDHVHAEISVVQGQGDQLRLCPYSAG